MSSESIADLRTNRPPTAKMSSESTQPSSNPTLVDKTIVVPALKWLVFGCGANSGYFGARLAQQGQHVSFMARTRTLAALRERGVQLLCGGDLGDTVVTPDMLAPPVDSEELPAEIFEADVIVLGCKAFQLQQALDLCRPFCGSSTIVLPLQNGVEGLFKVQREVETVWKVPGAKILGGVSNINSCLKGPAVISLNSPNPTPSIVFGEISASLEDHRVRILDEIFRVAPGMNGILEEPSVMPKLWEKFVFICATLAVESASSAPDKGPSGVCSRDQIALTPELQKLWRAAMQEIANLARVGYGMVYSDKWIENRLELLRKQVGAVSSTSRDMWAGVSSELDDLLGAVVRMGNEKGVATPVTTTLHTTLMERFEKRAMRN